MPLYRQDPNDLTKSIPNVNSRAATLEDTVTVPTAEIIQDRASSVIINQTGSYAFLYATTCSLGGASDNAVEKYQTGSILQVGVLDINTHPVTLPIRPVAWVNTAADGDNASSQVGDVQFIYVKRNRR